MLKEHLEIILITYNRKACLEKTLNAVLAESSPVKDLQITVLDNASTDGTSEYLQNLSAQKPNLKHIRNNKNIGPNANIAKIFEIASKPYFWPLCDDDAYDFSSFGEAEQAIKDGADLIIVNTELTKGDYSFPNMYRLLTFLPAAIYKTANITPTTLININNNIPNWFPHLAAVAHVINNGGKISAVSSDIVKRKGENDKPESNKKQDLGSITLPSINMIMPGMPPSQKYKFLEAGYYKSCELIENPSKRAQAVEACRPGVPFWRQIAGFITWNNVGCNNYLNNYADLKSVLNRKQKFIFNLMYFRSYFSGISYYLRRKKKQKEYDCLRHKFLSNEGKDA